MKKVLLLFVGICFFVILGEAQSAPEWVNSEVRGLNFPSEIYFAEFVQGNLHNDENVLSLLERLKEDAKRGVAGSVRTQIESQTEILERQITLNQDFSFSSLYQDYTRQTIQADIVGLKVESYYDESKKWGYAFAYVKKSDLIDYYRSQINLQLQQVQNTLSVATTAINAGQKVRARKSCEDALQPLAKAEFAQDLLTAINPSDIEALQLDRLANLKNELLRTLIDLEQSTYVYLHCSETNFGQTVRILEPELKRILSSNQCSFTDNPEEADYKITVFATTRAHEGSSVFGNSPLKFSMADVEVEIYSNYKHKVVYSEGISQKNNGDGATYESAGRNALKLSASAVFNGAKPFIIEK